MNTAQQKAAAFVAEYGLEIDPADRLLDLVSETGELAKEVLKGSAYGKEPFAVTPAWREELGDVFFSLLWLANSTGVDLEAALDDVLAKYRQRMAFKGDAGSGR